MLAAKQPPNCAPASALRRFVRLTSSSDATTTVDHAAESSDVAVPEERAVVAALEKEWVDEWQLTPVTVVMRMRRWPFSSAILLCAWLVLLLFGQLATTVWWLLQFGLGNLAALATVLGLFFGLALIELSLLQVAAASIALALTAMPVLNVYSAVALFVPPDAESDGQCSCWEVLHLPTFMVLAVMYFAEALPPVLRAEYSERPAMLAVLQVLDRAAWFAWIASAVMAALYAVVLLGVGAPRLCAWNSYPAQCNIEGPLAGRGLILSLHALGVVCAELQRLTIALYGEDLLRFLLYAGRALAPRLRGLSLARAARVDAPDATRRAEIYKHIVSWFDAELERLAAPSHLAPFGRMRNLGKRFTLLWNLLEEFVPTLRRASPPKAVVAFLLAVQRTAPLLAPGAGVLSQLAARSDRWPRASLVLGELLLALLLREAFNQWPAVPHSSLQRLALLVPKFYIDESIRAKIGYSLSTAKHIRSSSRSLARLFSIPRVVVCFALRPFSAFLLTSASRT